MTSLLNIGVSGLVSHQNALTTVGNNITNANVEGYSRQEAVFGSRASQRLDSGFVGSGVQITAIRRIADQFTATRLQNDLSRSTALDVLSAGISELDDLLANPNTGLSSVVEDFFSAIQAASVSPSSPELRQQVIGEAERLISRYRDIANFLETTVSTINESVAGTVSEVNRITASIAELNEQISASTLPSGAGPNDLLDQRAQLLRDLAERINFSTVVQDGTNVNVYLASGQALVIGASQNNLVVVDSEFGAQRPDIAVAIEGGGLDRVSSAISGGELGGFLRLVDEGIGGVANDVGLVVTLATNTLNLVNQQGVDLNQQPGRNLFTDINDRVVQLGRVTYSPLNSSPVAQASVEITDPTLLTATDYRLEIFAGVGQDTFTLTRLSDGVEVQQGTLSGVLPQTIATGDGFALTLESGGFAAGDVLTLSPAQLPTESIGVLLQSPAELAFGLPISVSANDDNQGTASIAGPTSNSIAALLAEDSIGGVSASQTPLLVRFTSQSTFDVLDNTDPENPVALVPPVTGLPFAPGLNNTIFQADQPIQPGSSIILGFDVEISGVPEAGDEFSIDPVFAGQGDNRNALAFASVQSADLLASGGTLTDIYASIVASVGVASASASIDADAANSLRIQSEERLRSESGVNLDEEAARLIQFEQAFNASAQVISVARTIFDSLLAAFR